MSATGLMTALETHLESLDLVNETVSALCAARVQNQKLNLNNFQIESTEHAYLIQKSLLDVYCDVADTQQTGWKVALSGVGAQQKYGINHPVYGFLTQSVEYLQHATLEQHPEDVLKLEVELVFTFKHQLDQMHFYSDAELIDAISEIRPALEIANVRWKDWNMSLPQFIADNSAAGAYVLGESIQFDLDPLMENPVQAVTSLIESSNTDYVITTTVTDQPIVNYLWLVRELLANNQTISSGQSVLTGSLIRPIVISVGNYEFVLAGQKLSINII